MMSISAAYAFVFMFSVSFHVLLLYSKIFLIIIWHIWCFYLYLFLYSIVLKICQLFLMLFYFIFNNFLITDKYSSTFIFIISVVSSLFSYHKFSPSASSYRYFFLILIMNSNCYILLSAFWLCILDIFCLLHRWPDHQQPKCIQACSASNSIPLLV